MCLILFWVCFLSWELWLHALNMIQYWVVFSWFLLFFWQNEDRSLWKLGTLPPGLVTFWNKTFPLSRSWHVLGLGYNPHVNSRDIEHAAVIHYNGNMKPWLEIGLPKFRSYWSKYLDYDQSFLRECNINPWRNLVLLVPSDITNSLFSVDVHFSVVSIVLSCFRYQLLTIFLIACASCQTLCIIAGISVMFLEYMLWSRANFR